MAKYIHTSGCHYIARVFRMASFLKIIRKFRLFVRQNTQKYEISKISHLFAKDGISADAT